MEQDGVDLAGLPSDGYTVACYNEWRIFLTVGQASNRLKMCVVLSVSCPITVGRWGFFNRKKLQIY